METKEIFQLRPIDWRWLVVSYCFLVLFHLLPSFLVTDFLFTVDEPLRFLLWLAIGVAVLCAVIAFQSRGITVLEPALAAVFYAFTIVGTARIPWKYNRDFRLVTIYMLVLIGAFVVGCLGAAFGEWLQMRKSHQAPSGRSPSSS